ncbi:uncharacterized protein LOC134241370 [Saccostrea cucullata]|uniref:uncharacterized protein LOC134241370 n=1 Tax=Saccostrea cuccullata TaxID=36930 RepID=UPI002ED30585
MRQRGRFAGFSLYISYTPHKENGHLCYRNTLPLPPLEFNTTCIGYGRYVIYYNERLDGVTYPEGYQLNIYTQLCEVENVRGDGRPFGKDSCAGHCRGNQPCNHVTGQCEAGCANGWMGKLCDERKY